MKGKNMFIRNFFGLSIIVLTVILLPLFNDPLAYAQTDQEEVDKALETGIFMDQAFAWVPLPAWIPKVDESSARFMVKLRLLTYPPSIFIKAFAVEKKDSPSTETTEKSLSSVTFYFSSTEEGREIKFMVSVPVDLPFESSGLRLEFYREKDGAPEKISAQVSPIVLL